MHPDLIIPLDQSKPDGLQAFVWIEAVEITRQAERKLVLVDGLEDKWRLQLPLRASLAINGQLQYNADGSEMPCAVPRIPGVNGCMVNDIAHVPEVKAMIAGLRDMCLSIISGKIKPVIPPTEDEIEAQEAADKAKAAKLAAASQKA